MQRETKRERGVIARELALALICAAVTALVAIACFALESKPATTGAAGPRSPRGIAPLMMLTPPAQVSQMRIDVPDFPPAQQPVEQSPALSPSRPKVEQIIETPIEAAADSTGFTPTFDGRPIRPIKTIRMLVTAYSPDERSCGIWADGITASGYSVHTNATRLVAADTSLLPFGTILTIPGYNNGWPVPVLDRGGAIKGNRLDVLYATHEEALVWGKQWIEVTVWDYAD